MEIKTIEQVREMFKNDHFATENGSYIAEIGDHYAKCTLEIKELHKNALGAVMGGVPFTLADFTFAVASNWQKSGTVSLSSNITYLSVAKGTSLIAEANCIRDGRTTCYYKIDVSDNLGNLIAVVTTTGYHK